MALVYRWHGSGMVRSSPAQKETLTFIVPTLIVASSTSHRRLLTSLSSGAEVTPLLSWVIAKTF
eukprot:5657235-Amphidinium_carterae.1